MMAATRVPCAAMVATATTAAMAETLGGTAAALETAAMVARESMVVLGVALVAMALVDMGVTAEPVPTVVTVALAV